MNRRDFIKNTIIGATGLLLAPTISWATQPTTVSEQVRERLTKEGYTRTARWRSSEFVHQKYEKNGYVFELRRYLSHPKTFMVRDQSDPCRFVWEVQRGGLTEIIYPHPKQVDTIVRAVKWNTPNITITSQKWACFHDGQMHTADSFSEFREKGWI